MLQPVVRRQAARRYRCRSSCSYDGGLGPSREPAGARGAHHHTSPGVGPCQLGEWQHWENGDVAFAIPRRLVEICGNTPERSAWLSRLAATLRDLERRWSLTVGVPFDGDDVSCAWVAPVTLATGQSAVLTLGMPHMEGKHEIEGLRFWNGDPTVRLLDADDDLGAMLLERCEPGTALRGLPGPEQDEIIATLLRRLWRTPAEPHRFRPLSAMTAHWCRETMTDMEQWPSRRPRVRCDPASAELQREVARGCAWNHPPRRGSPRRR